MGAWVAFGDVWVRDPPLCGCQREFLCVCACVCDGWVQNSTPSLLQVSGCVNVSVGAAAWTGSNGKHAAALDVYANVTDAVLGENVAACVCVCVGGSVDQPQKGADRNAGQRVGRWNVRVCMCVCACVSGWVVGTHQPHVSPLCFLPT